ncbi:unannotated protein [freshwater metagenome]|jgi:hypothetical protein|uniref:Unannotated protein n=1 Tax=freshwater metagenome TaxID=449393 RepID=A0A6J6GSJ1_9ZZZZ|nr:hypothetical protein [Actinomycetota bacterium]
MNLRAFIKRTKAGQLIWRIFIGILGGTITVLGAIALVAPGPGVLILLAGLGILASEFAWAARAVNKTKSMAQSAADKVGIPTWIKYLFFAGAALFSIIAIVIYLH